MSRDLAFALDLADLADSLSLPRFRAADLRVETKPDLSPVTDADAAVERALRERIGAARPGDAIVGEEEGGAAGGAVRWILDPIDGTKNFSRGIPVWATLIALERDGEIVCGVASAPALGHR
ncbi:MAG TPA: inositol monophosphatase family protein, partial [Gaiellaceae bacterium]|nr:inositol monophosphatase family protein [Gaiellaceae bacterium]